MLSRKLLRSRWFACALGRATKEQTMTATTTTTTTTTTMPSTRTLKTDEEHQKEMLKKKQQSEQELRRAILEEYEKRRMNKIKRYSRRLPYYNVDLDFIANDLLHYPLLAKETLCAESEGEFEKQAALAMYNKREQDALNKHLLITKIPERTNITVDVPTPTVSNVIEIGQPLPSALLEWQFQKIRVLGHDGFYKYKSDSLRVGNIFHRFIANQLRTKRENVEASWPTDLSEYEGVIDVKRFEQLNQVFKRVGKVILIETDCTHKNLFYVGRIDCLAYFDDELFLIDWKINETRRETIVDLYDAPIQIAAYLGAYLNDPKHARIRREHKIKGGLFVNICKTTGEVDLHFINYQLAEYFWYKWLVFMRKFWTNVLKDNNQL